MKIRKRLIAFLAVFQSIIFLTHFFVYKTWTFSATGSDAAGPVWLKLSLGVLSVTFVAASLLGFRWTNAALRVFYRAAAGAGVGDDECLGLFSLGREMRPFGSEEAEIAHYSSPRKARC